MISTSLPDSDELRRFRKNENAVARLAELLSDPVMRQAIDIVARLAIPRTLPDSAAGLHPDTNTAHHMHMLIGISQAISKLQKMTTPILQGQLDEEDEIHREEFQDYADKITKMNIIKPS
jgi:hypothetical protein